MKKRCVIVGGADINNYDYLNSILNEDDYIICCDSGLKHIEHLKLEADLIVGDFDSHPRPITSIELIELPREKDDTDTMYGIKEGLKRGYDNFLLIGVLGQRMDHSLVNIYALLYLKDKAKKAIIIDDYSEMEIVAQDEVLIEDKYPYFSLLNISGIAKGVTIENAKFPLYDGDIACEYQYAVSNEVVKGKCAKVSVKEGLLLLIKDR